MENSLNLPSRQLAHRHGEYGFDEPVWPLLFSLLGVLSCVEKPTLSVLPIHIL